MVLSFSFLLRKKERKEAGLPLVSKKKVIGFALKMVAI